MVLPTPAPWTAYPKTLAGIMLTVAEAVLLVSAWLVAVTVVLANTVAAVKSPELEIEPALAVHVTAVLVEPVTVALNCWVPPETTVATLGETLTATPDGPHVPPVRLLLKPFKIFPEPMFVLLAELIPPPKPVPAVTALLLMQPFVPLESSIMPAEPGPLMEAPVIYTLAPSM